jgi:hypothetical protein
MIAGSNLAALSNDELAECRGGLSFPTLLRAFGAAKADLGRVTQYHEIRTKLGQGLGVASEPAYVASAEQRIAKRTLQADRFYAGAMQKYQLNRLP